MYLGLQQKQQLAQKLIMTPQLQMAVKLLQLFRLELMQKIGQELEENPALEEAGELSFENNPSPGNEEIPADTNLTDDAAVEDKIIEAIRREYQQDSSAFRETVSRESENRDYPGFEHYTAARETLTDHLLW